MKKYTENTESDLSKFTVAQRTKTPEAVKNKDYEFKPEDYQGEIMFYGEPIFYNFFVAKDDSKIMLVSANLDLEKTGKDEVEYISDDHDPRFNAIIDLCKAKDTLDNKPAVFTDFSHKESYVKLSYRFIDHTSLIKSKTVDDIIKIVNEQEMEDNNTTDKVEKKKTALNNETPNDEGGLSEAELNALKEEVDGKLNTTCKNIGNNSKTIIRVNDVNNKLTSLKNTTEKFLEKSPKNTTEKFLEKSPSQNRQSNLKNEDGKGKKKPKV